MDCWSSSFPADTLSRGLGDGVSEHGFSLWLVGLGLFEGPRVGFPTILIRGLDARGAVDCYDLCL
jgi:hypothetical protein